MKRNPRLVLGETLASIAHENQRVLAVSCDSASGSGMKPFLDTFPDRYIEIGISEQNAIDVCVGLSLNGFIPVVSAIAPFISMRCYEQIRNDVGYSKTNVKIIGSSSGISQSQLGSSHMAVEDIAVMNSIPNLTIINPGDPFEVEMALRKSIEIEGPVYIRMIRHAVDDIAPRENRQFQLDKAEVLSDGEDIMLFSTGVMTAEAIEAARLLNENGVSAGVVNFPVVKPLDAGIVFKYAKAVKHLVTIEEHSVTGGFGSIAAQALAAEKDTAPLHIIGIPEGAVSTGPYRELLESYGLTGRELYKRISSYL